MLGFEIRLAVMLLELLLLALVGFGLGVFKGGDTEADVVAEVEWLTSGLLDACDDVSGVCDILVTLNLLFFSEVCVALLAFRLGFGLEILVLL